MKKKPRRLTTPIVLVLVAGGVIYHASRHAPTGPAEGVQLNTPAAGSETGPRPSSTDRPTLRIGTFNIHGGKGRDGRRDLGRVADCIGSDRLDFVALNEVHGPRGWQQEDQAARLGRRLGMAWLFAPAVRVWYYREAGNGLLSTLPVSFWQRIPLSRRYDHSHRNIVLVGLEHGGRPVHVLLTHVNRRYDSERQAQLRAVIALFLALAEPAILVGDMNSGAEDPQIGRLLETPGVGDPVGEVLGPETPPRIDWIFTRGFRPVDAGIRDDGASDHPMIWAEIELLEEGRQAGY